jgi:hypothetical protein
MFRGGGRLVALLLLAGLRPDRGGTDLALEPAPMRGEGRDVVQSREYCCTANLPIHLTYDTHSVHLQNLARTLPLSTCPIMPPPANVHFSLTRPSVTVLLNMPDLA